MRFVKYAAIAIAIVFISSLVIGLITTTLRNLAEDDGLSELLDIVNMANEAGLPATRALSDAMNCEYPCKNELTVLHNQFVSYEQSLAEAIARLDSVNVPSNYIEVKSVYRNLLESRMEFAILYISGINSSGEIVNQDKLQQGDDKALDAQRIRLGMPSLIEEAQR